jgi:hypothetical protein
MIASVYVEKAWLWLICAFLSVEQAEEPHEEEEDEESDDAKEDRKEEEEKAKKQEILKVLTHTFTNKYTHT